MSTAVAFPRTRRVVAVLTGCLALFALLAIPTTSSALAGSAYVRLNQLGYPMGVGFGLVSGGEVVSHAATPTTIVTIQFDDGLADQYQTLAILGRYGLHATYYVNTGVTGDVDHMSWTQLQDLYAADNEIGGHTLLHTNIKKLKAGPARQTVCTDRNNLYSHGLNPVSFAYPFGSYDAGSEAVVQACGYNSARTVSGVNDRKVYAETVPPLDPYATRTPPNPKQGTTLATIEGYVTAAETHGGGWVQLVFHHVCDNNCDAYSITPANLDALSAWLAARAASGTVVETTAQVVGGPVNPPVTP
jgi:peptidoglycan/xylan/chitin deacetylase (PgdA/CDA1 family)